MRAHLVKVFCFQFVLQICAQWQLGNRLLGYTKERRECVVSLMLILHALEGPVQLIVPRACWAYGTAVT